MLTELKEVKNDVDEMLTVGYAYINAARFAEKLAREQYLYERSQNAHNRSLGVKTTKKEPQTVSEIEAELARLQAKLDQKRSMTV